MVSNEVPQPPAPPRTRPRLRVPLPNLLGIAAFATVPVLALLGVLGRTTGAAGAAGETIALHVTFPTRMRYGTGDSIGVEVRNISGGTLDLVTVRFDRGYISGFSNVRFTPQPIRAYEVALRNMGPGETRLVSAEIEAEAYWSRSGAVTAAGGGESVTVPVRTLTYP